MYGQPPNFRPGGSGRGPMQQPQQPQLIHLNSSLFPNANLFINRGFVPHLNPFLQNPNNFPPVHQQFPTNNFPIPMNSDTINFQTPFLNFDNNNNSISKFPQQQSEEQKEMIGKVDKAVTRARQDLLDSNKNVSAWEVSQVALLMVKAESWESLGFQMQQVPSLNRLLVTEGKINAFIHCFVAVRRITSLYDLEVAICENEGIERFEELELGPLVRHPLAVHYFSVTSEVTEVYRIGTEELISYLCKFIDTHKRKEVRVDGFLDFVSKKQSISGREKLCVRIQNIGIYISNIRRVGQEEDTVLQKCLEKTRKRALQRSKKRQLFSAQKKQLDDNFNSISQRIKSFSSETTQFGGKHIRFMSSSSEDDDSEDTASEDNLNENNNGSNCNLILPNVRSDRLSSCPYPSATEEKTRLGLKSEDSGGRCSADSEKSQKKRKFENANSTILPCKLSKRNKKGSDNQDINGHLLSNESLKLFATTWKEACRGNNAEEVLERMLQSYNVKKRKKVKALFTSFPFIGLLNVAVTCIKFGMWDNMYDSFQTFSEQSASGKTFDRASDYISVDVEPAKKDVAVSAQKILAHKHGVKAEDIAKKISGYFEEYTLSFTSPSRENKFVFLRKLCKCEYWLIEQYSINEFKSLGYGEYFMFLDKYMHLLPYPLQKWLIGDIFKKDYLEAYLLPLQFDILLSQALNSLWENESVNLQNISKLLARQFPSVCFKPVKSNLVENIGDILREKLCNLSSKCVLFSSPLLVLNCMADFLAQNEKKRTETSGFNVDTGHKEGMIGPVTTKDAIDVLHKAPMLTDLSLWSHWDHLFAPSLGSMVEWLLNEVNTTELLFLVTKDTKVIRIDHSATMDSLLKVFIKGSPFETAVQLLSLFALHGGERNVPLSLLKCHARQAFETIINNSLEMELYDKNLVMHRKPSCDQHIVEIFSTSHLGSKLPNNRSIHNRAVSVMSRFVLDCLSYLPIEFCSFAVDVLVAGMQLFVKDAPSAILSECKQVEQRVMLHEVGMSLGLVEWIDDYHSFHFSATSGFSPGSSRLDVVNYEFNTRSMIVKDVLNKQPSSSGEMLVPNKADSHDFNGKRVSNGSHLAEASVEGQTDIIELSTVDNHRINNDPARVIESIRKEEFGLGQCLSATENKMLEKQHARLGRALHCLSQELYSQDSHFLLELVQNADDNIYPENVEPTLTFILQGKCIIVLNNEQGFLAENIRALCDVGNSTKKGRNAGYIGKKGIGFKSVFRVTDAPEIHSNGFHIKFDITEGQIGFVLPTVVPPCDMDLYARLASADADLLDCNSWNTCIVLPFKSTLSEGFSINNIISMFSDLHPSLLLFLHRLQCIKFRNILDDSLIVMRKEVLGDGIVEVSLGNEKMTWFVMSQKLKADVIRSDVETTEISIAFTLQETVGEGYAPILNQQPVFAFLPLRTYGLKFILQGDFVLPSSREEIDVNSPWNQWLLSEFPDLFVSAERAFCDLPCYRGSPGKAVTTFMSFVPLLGEVHGFFSSLPRMIISKLRVSSCLLLDFDEEEWVPPCKVLRNWTDQTRSLLPDFLISEHLGLGFLNKDIVLSDSLARALGVEEYGPKILLGVISSLCRSANGLKSMGLSWLSSWLSAVYLMSSHSFMQTSSGFGAESDFIFNLQKTPFIPLSDGQYGSLYEDSIWLPSEVLSQGINDDCVLKAFPKLYAKLRIVSPNLLAAAATIESSCSDTTIVENVTRMLYKVGVQQLSAHEIVKVHILPSISDDKNAIGGEDLMIEYLSFAMFHLQSSCNTCGQERGGIMKELREKALILTNFGYRRSNEVPIHFSQKYENPIDINKLISGVDVKWHEIDDAYMKHPITKSISGGELKWRIFFQDMGVTDFVQIVQVEKNAADMSLVDNEDTIWGKDMMSMDAVVKDWDSEELFRLLSWLSKTNDWEKSKYLLEILDIFWDDYFSDKVTGYCIDSTGESKPFKSSIIRILQDVPWMMSNIEKELHYPKDLFHDCVAVNSVLGVSAPYTIPKVKSMKLLADIGLKTLVTLDDALSVLRLWRRSESPLKASVSQMSNFYAFLWKEMSLSKRKIIEELLSGPCIFIPYASCCSHDEAVPGALLSPQDVCWHDTIVSVDQMKSDLPECVTGTVSCPLRNMLYNFYPNLHDFFVNECGVNESPPFCSYLQILLQLSTIALPHQAAKRVFEVFSRWSEALKSGSLSLEDVEYLKESLLKKEYTVLPTRHDKWVSLHASFGLICWSDDDNLSKEFKHLEGVDFLYFGEFSDEENQMLQSKFSTIIQKLGIPALSEIVSREAIYYGPADCNHIFSLMNWILPYAQRYILNAHLDKYFQLKQSGFENLRHLKIVAVEKLFYQNVIKRCKITSKKRYECDCLLQDNILYCSRGSDSHTIFMEFSRLLYDGNPDLHFANFLHMITTMAESGAAEEQTEFFILNSQKVPKLPAGEFCWSLQSDSVSLENNAMLVENSLPLKVEQNYSMSSRRLINSNWPPVDWKTAPGFKSVNAFGLKKPAAGSLQITGRNVAEEIQEQIVISQTEFSVDFNVEDDPMIITPGASLLNAESSESQSDPSSILVASEMGEALDSVGYVTPDIMNFSQSNSTYNDQQFGQQEALLTGRIGELTAFKYFVGKLGDALVNWVNETRETGLPYDIITGDENSKEYIEVKATKATRKNWFLISMREWQFAIEKGESFSIAHVILSDNNLARVTIYKNPARLCQLGNLKLAVVVPKR